jgi:hypothetical protein
MEPGQVVVAAQTPGQVVQRRQTAPVSGAVAVQGEVEDGDSAVDELEQTRLELASELNKLEADFERGDLDEDAYQRERDEILEELRGISLRMRGMESESVDAFELRRRSLSARCLSDEPKSILHPSCLQQ